MFCKKCGKELNDNAKFCNGCGAPVNGAEASGSKSSAQSDSLPPILQNLFSRLTALFTKKDTVATVADSTNDKTLSGLIWAGFGVLMLALSAAINSYFFLTTFIFTILGKSAFFGLGLLMTRVLIKSFCKKDISWQGSINLVAYSATPIIAVGIANMILGLIPIIPLASILSATALGMYYVLLYSGMAKVVGSFKEPFFAFVLVVLTQTAGEKFLNIIPNFFNSSFGLIDKIF